MYQSSSYRRSRNAYTAECAFEYFVSLLVTDSFLSRLLLNLGLSESAIGIISSLISLVFLFQIFSLPVIHRITKRKRFTVTVHTLGQLGFMLLYIVPFLGFNAEINLFLSSALLLIAYCGNYFVTSLIYQWGNSFVEPAKRGVFSGNKEMISLLSGVIVQLASGKIIDYYVGLGNVEGSFIFCAVSILIFTVLDFICLLSIENKDNEEKPEPGQPLKDILSHTLGDKDFRKITCLNCLWKAAIYAVSGFVGAYKLQELGMSITTIQIINICACLGRFAVSKPFGRFSDKYSYLKGFNLGLIIMILSTIALIFTNEKTKVLVIVYTVLFNASYAGTYANSLNMTYDYCEKKYFAEGMAIKNSISGAVGFIFSVISGKILTIYQNSSIKESIGINGTQVLAIISLIISIITLIFSYMAIKEKSVDKEISQ